MHAHDADRLMFGDYELDLQTRLLSHLEHNIPLRPRSIDVLAHLVRGAGVLITKDDIISSVWPGAVLNSRTKCNTPDLI